MVSIHCTDTHQSGLEHWRRQLDQEVVGVGLVLDRVEEGGLRPRSGDERGRGQAPGRPPEQRELETCSPQGQVRDPKDCSIRQRGSPPNCQVICSRFARAHDRVYKLSVKSRRRRDSRKSPGEIGRDSGICTASCRSGQCVLPLFFIWLVE